MDDDTLAHLTAPYKPEPRTRAALITDLHAANNTAKRLADTVYWTGAHGRINDILDELCGR